MNTFTTNMNTNPLRVALIISMLLHLIGFYFLSNYSFNSTLRTPKITPITVRTLVEKKGIQAMAVKYVTQQNPIQSVHLPKLASNKLSNIFNSKPTPIFDNYSQSQTSQPILIAQLPQKMSPMKLASKKRPSPSPVKSKYFFRETTIAATPRMTMENQPLYQSTDIPATPSRLVEISQSEAFSQNLQARLNFKNKANEKQSFKPVALYKGLKNIKNSQYTQSVRNISLNHALNEESLKNSHTKTMAKSTPVNKNSSSSDLGKLRRGFQRKIWQKVAKAKYYPRIARERGFEGEPIVTFTLGSKGELIGLKLIIVSRYKLLNEAALETVRRGIPYPAIPKSLERNSISFNLPISYVLEK